MSDWSVTRLINEYRSDEDSAPRSAPRTSRYSKALQNVLEALTEETSNRQTLTEKALEALFNSSPLSSPINPDELQPQSEQTSESAVRDRPFTTSDALELLVEQLDHPELSVSKDPTIIRSLESSLPDDQSVLRGNPILAAAARLWDNSRYSLDADWKLGYNELQSASSQASTRRVDSDLDQADFPLLPPALGKKPLTPLGEKDKKKASTPPEPVVSRTLVERKRKKSNVSIEVNEPQVEEPQAPDSPAIPPPSLRGKIRGKLKKQVKGRKQRMTMKDLRMRKDALRNSPSDFSEDEPTQVIQNPIGNQTTQDDGADETVDYGHPEFPSTYSSEEASRVDETSFILNTNVIHIPPDETTNDSRLAGNTIGNLPQLEEGRARSAKANRGNPKQTRTSSDGKNTQKKRQGRRKSNETVIAGAPEVTAVEQLDVNAPDSPIAGLESINEESKPSDNRKSKKARTSNGTESQQLGSNPPEMDVLKRLQAVAQKASEKVKSPSWITPRPAALANQRRSADIQITKPREDPDEVNELEDQPPPDFVEDAAPDIEPTQALAIVDDTYANEQLVEVSPPKKARPKRSVLTQELVSVNSTRPASKTQVSTLSLNNKKKQRPKVEQSVPGPLRRISICESGSENADDSKIIRPRSKRIRVPALRWWAGERIEYRSEDGTLSKTIATAVYKKEDAQVAPRRRQLALPAPDITEQSVVSIVAQLPQEIMACKLRIDLPSLRANEDWWKASDDKPKAVPAKGVIDKKRIVIRRSSAPEQWQVMVVHQCERHTSVLIRLPPSETNGQDLSKMSELVVELVKGESVLVLMNRVLEEGGLGARKGVRLTSVGGKVIVPCQHQYQFKNVSETEEAVLLTHVLPFNDLIYP